MNKPAAIRGTFSDFRLIKGRKVAQIVCEVPIEEADAALATLGGLPQPASERWIALAPLNITSIKPQKEKRRFEDLKTSLQAVLLCKEPRFQQFLRDCYGSEAHGDDDEDAANCVRRYCGVASRSALNLDPKAAGIWRQMESHYQAWLRVTA